MCLAPGHIIHAVRCIPSSHQAQSTRDLLVHFDDMHPAIADQPKVGAGSKSQMMIVERREGEVIMGKWREREAKVWHGMWL